MAKEKGKCDYLYIGGMRVPMENVLVTVTGKNGTVNKYRAKPKSPGKERGTPPIKTIAELKSLPKNSSIVATIYDPQTGNEIGKPFAFDPSKAFGTEGRKLAAKGYIKEEWDQFADNKFVADLLAKGVSYGESRGLTQINTAQLAWLASASAGKEVVKNILESADPSLDNVKCTLAAVWRQAIGKDNYTPFRPEDEEAFLKLVPRAVALGYAQADPLAGSGDNALQLAGSRDPEALERLYNALAQVSASSGSGSIEVAMRTIEVLRNNPLFPDALYEKTVARAQVLSHELNVARGNERVAEETIIKEKKFQEWRKAYEEHADAARTGLRSLQAGQIERATRFLHGETLVSAIAHSEDPDEIRELAEYADKYGIKAYIATLAPDRVESLLGFDLRSMSWKGGMRAEEAIIMDDVVDALLMNPATPLVIVQGQAIKFASLYKIGGVGPAGGIIFAVESGMCREAAPEDIGAFKWDKARAEATRYTTTRNGTTYNDWYLPSKDELNTMYKNRDRIGGFSTDYYWSSSEEDANTAWDKNFDLVGMLTANFKYNIVCVRPVRAFSI